MPLDQDNAVSQHSALAVGLRLPPLGLAVPGYPLQVLQCQATPFGSCSARLPPLGLAAPNYSLSSLTYALQSNAQGLQVIAPKPHGPLSQVPLHFLSVSTILPAVLVASQERGSQGYILRPTQSQEAATKQDPSVPPSGSIFLRSFVYLKATRYPGKFSFLLTPIHLVIKKAMVCSQVCQLSVSRLYRKTPVMEDTCDYTLASSYQVETFRGNINADCWTFCGMNHNDSLLGVPLHHKSPYQTVDRETSQLKASHT